jgi:hypothetical protein
MGDMGDIEVGGTDRAGSRPGAAPERPKSPPPDPLALTCRDVIGLLLDYLEATLGPDAAAAFERHLQDCAPCRAYARTYDRSRQLVAEVSQVEMPPEMKARLRGLLLGRLGATPS